MEEWTRWEPIDGLSGKYFVDSLLLEEDLVIKLSDKNSVKKIEIRFEYAIDTYRYTNESFCFKIFGDLSEKYGNGFYKNWSFFKINNSEYSKWLSEKSRTVSDKLPFIHFCILGGDEIVEILAGYEPTVKIVEG